MYTQLTALHAFSLFLIKVFAELIPSLLHYVGLVRGNQNCRINRKLLQRLLKQDCLAVDLCAFDKFVILYLDSKFPSPTKSSLLRAEQSQVSPSPCIPSLSVTGKALFLFIMSMPCTGQPRACAPALHVCNTTAVQRHLWCSTYSSDLDRD